MSKPKIITILHVPYGQRGGEDVHVEELKFTYEQLGYEVRRLPLSPGAFSPKLTSSLQSLLPIPIKPNPNDIAKIAESNLVHIHNVFPEYGPGFIRWLTLQKIPAIMTVHNHRFFCTNGLALRDGNNCTDCLQRPELILPIRRNCNSSWHKSIYHSFALWQIRSEQLWHHAIRLFIAPSEYIRSVLISAGYPAEKIKVVPHPSPFTAASLQTLEETAAEYDVVFAGRLAPEKGIETLVDACQLLPDLKFAFVGDGPEGERLKEKILATKNICWIKAASREDALQTIAASKIAVLPSLCNEILSLFLLEALSLGKRCVVSDTNSMQWFIDSKLPVTNFKRGSAPSLAAAIKSALQQNSVSKAELAMIQKRFSKDVFKDSMSTIVAESAR